MKPMEKAWTFLKDSRQTKLGDFAPINRVALPEPEEPYTGFNEFGDRIHPDGTFIPGDEMTDEEHMQMVKDRLRLTAQQAANEEYSAKEEAAKNRAIGRVAIKPVSLGEAPAEVTPSPKAPPRHQVKIKRKREEPPPPKEKGPTKLMSDWQKARLKEQAELTDEERARRVKELNEKHVKTIRIQRDIDAGKGLQHEGKGNPFNVENCSNCGGGFVDHSVGAHSMCNACLNADDTTRAKRRK